MGGARRRALTGALAWPAHLGAIVSVAFAMVAAPPLTAAQTTWHMQPAVSLGLGYDDNVTLDPDDPISSFGASLSAAVRGERATENAAMGLRAGLNLDIYFDERDLDTFAGLIGWDATRFSERSRWRLDTRLSTESTLTSETATTGVTGLNEQQLQIAVEPSWAYRLSERAIVDVSAGFEGTFYEDSGDLGLNDYYTGTLSLGGDYRLSERAGTTATFSYERYDARGIASEAETLGALFGGDYQLSQTTALGALAGVRRTEVTRSAAPNGLRVTEDSTGPTYSVWLGKQLARGGSFQLEALREVTPSGTAEVLDTTSLAFWLSYPFSERWGLDLRLQGYRNRDPSGEASTSDRKYADGDLTLSYALSEAWRLTLGYRYRWQEYDELSRSAEGNTVTLTLAWTGRAPEGAPGGWAPRPGQAGRNLPRSPDSRLGIQTQLDAAMWQ
ncbi:hypothetical protein ABC977_08860 [Thioalkalicoccus limnaeus]|uniref:Outer membrane beta-barrel protein n=1 Tax=Thioalkalicoccus limnaeus TaxID=120681 RepID=A0ABV4BDB6_9GAMM